MFVLKKKRDIIDMKFSDDPYDEWCKNYAGWVENHSKLNWVWERSVDLHQQGLLEKYLVEAFTAHNINNHHFYTELGMMFFKSDVGKLRAAGRPLPKGNGFKLYRGIQDVKWADGYSWTSDIKVARHFADRVVGGFVVESNVDADEVLFYTNSREESEFVLDPINISWGLM